MKYCKVAYTANLRQFKGAIEKDMSGLEMYKRLADGRHEGLVDLPPESAGVFKQWYHSGRSVFDPAGRLTISVFSAFTFAVEPKPAHPL